MSGAIFSDSWYKIADARVSLLPGVAVHRQLWRGRAWVVLEDAYSHRFFRLTPEAYDFIRELTPEVRIDDAWQRYLQEHPEKAPGQEEVVQLLSQLHAASLLYFRDGSNDAEIFERKRERNRKEWKSKLLSFLFFRIPIWDPDPMLERLHQVLKRVPGLWGLGLWVLVCLAGTVVVLKHLPELTDEAQGAFALVNLPWLYLCLAVNKLLHELGHGYVCKRYGGRVHTFGLMFLVTTPLPYVDTTSTWAFPNKWHRIFVSAAGMLVDLFLAAMGALVWASTGPGLVNSLGFNLMLIGSVSSLLFNGNPLLRFDAYYMLADWVGIPNFYQKAQQYWYYLGDRYLLGSHAAKAPVDDEKERNWFLVYAPLSFIYRLLVTTGIVVFVMDLWFGLGLMVLLTTLIAMVIMPLIKLVEHLTGPGVQSHRSRAFAGFGVVFLSMVLLFFVIPFPYALNAHGVLQSSRQSILFAPVDGRIKRSEMGHGQTVQFGQSLLTIDDASLRLDIEQAEMERNELSVLERKTLTGKMAEIHAVRKQIDAKTQRLQDLSKRLDTLKIKAPHEGRFVSIESREKVGAWVQQGTELGHVVDTNAQFELVAVVNQERAREIFDAGKGRLRVRLVGQSDETLAIDQLVVLPYQRNRLPSAALGWMGGGEMPVSVQDGKGETSAEDFFEVRARVVTSPEQHVVVVSGIKGVLCIEMPHRSLYSRLEESVRQLIQKRYFLG